MLKSELFVINLERNLDRLANIQKSFDSVNLSCTRVEAIDGSKMKQSYIDEINSHRRKLVPFSQHILSKGEIGCASSHLLLYERLLNSNMPFIFILEDDVEFGNQLKEIIENQTKLLNIDFDILFL